MTSTLEDPAPEVGSFRRGAVSPAKGALRMRWRVAARLARRQVRRTALSSILIAVLVMLPIAAMTGYAIVAMSMVPSAQERATAELGRMEAWLAVTGVPGEGFWQAPTEPQWYGYATDAGFTSDAPPLGDPLSLLPAGTEALRLAERTVRVETPAGVTTMRATSGESWDPRFAGKFDVRDGRVPAARDEVMVTPAALDRLGIRIGDEVRLSADDRTLTVTGTLDAAELGDDVPALFLAESADFGGEARWYLPELVLDWPDVQTLNDDGVVALSRTVLLDPPVIDPTEVQGSYDAYAGQIWSIVMLLATAGLFAAYVVVMLAGAAFAVAGRRQQRSLAVAASVGATAGDLRRTVLLQGTLLGLVGGIAGLVLGVGAAILTVTLTSDGSATQYWGFHVPWPLLAAILVFSVLVGTASAAAPAHTVARSDTLAALRGARRPQRPTASRPVWGSVLLVLGIALTLGSSFTILAVDATDIPWDSPLRTIPPFGVVAGPIIVQVGILLSGRWLLWTTSRMMSPLGLAARLASRDAAANSSRTVPAFAAIAATVFLAVFAVGQGAMQSSASARDWFYQAPIGSMAVTFYSGDTGQAPDPLDGTEARAAADAGLELAETAGASATAVVAQQLEPWWYPNVEEIGGGENRVIAVLPERHLLDPTVSQSFTGNGQSPSNPLSVIAPDELETALGVRLSPAQLDAYRDGAAVAADPRYVTSGTIRVSAWSARDVYEGRTPDNVWMRTENTPDLADPVWERRLEAITVDAPLQPTLIAVSPDTAEDLGISAQPTMVIASFDDPVPTDTRDRVQAQSELLSTPEWIVAPSFEEGPPSDAVWIAPILIAVTTLVLGASSVALSLARVERRPDDATLSAVGGTRGLRRRIGFWQGLLIAGFGTVAGTAAGILPPVGFAIQSRGTLQLDDVPWLLLGLLAVALPLGIAAASWLVPPRRPDLTRRTVIA
ncbi:FtsX-like permease family protein [Streptomyces sp. AC495_CC817]|uniref:FtsX-like permease family protein n=1 Tax=Streptomyces sp. AC495_CC817 TaxID=2823900 RepID=UPI001C27DFB1|nr:FtsX-like permease family protein [Streptomyces sp. AC495_CC817]